MTAWRVLWGYTTRTCMYLIHVMLNCPHPHPSRLPLISKRLLLLRLYSDCGQQSFRWVCLLWRNWTSASHGAETPFRASHVAARGIAKTGASKWFVGCLISICASILIRPGTPSRTTATAITAKRALKHQSFLSISDLLLRG